MLLDVLADLGDLVDAARGDGIQGIALATQILARKYENLSTVLKKFKNELYQGVEKKAAKLEQFGINKYIETM